MITARRLTDTEMIGRASMVPRMPSRTRARGKSSPRGANLETGHCFYPPRESHEAQNEICLLPRTSFTPPPSVAAEEALLQVADALS